MAWGAMAQIWFLYDGPQPVSGGPAYRVAVAECIDKLDIFNSRYCSGLSQIPTFHEGNTLGPLAGYRHAVMKLDEEEATTFGWKAGYYRLALEPREVIARLTAPDSEASRRAS